MANVEKIRFVQSEPFLKTLETLLEKNFSLSKNDRVLNVIEIGCGPGDFALIFKDKFKERVQVTAIDPSDDIEKAQAKSTGNDVKFERSDIFKFTSDVKYDLVMFTKSLHHCIPVDQAVKNAYNLLSDDGVFFAEEIYVDKMNAKEITWFFDRVDLLRSAECMKTVEEVLKTTSFNKNKLAQMMNPDLPISERWFRPHIHNETGKKPEHGHGHGHGHGHAHNEEHHHEHTHDHGHGHEHHHDHDDTIVGSSAVVQAITAQFGKEKLTFEDVPYFYQFLVFFGIKDTETNKAVLREFYKQEVRAMDNKIISPLGINIIGHK